MINDPIIAGTHPGTDFLISSMYVRASTKLYAPSAYYEYSFDRCVSYHKGFYQQYFVSKAESAHVSSMLLNDIVNRNLHMENILEKIEKRIQNIDHYLRNQTKNPYKNLQKLLLLNIDLYKHCRIPENLDRGGFLFTQWLMEKIAETSTHSKRHAIKLLFAYTSNRHISPIRQRDLELTALCEEIISAERVLFENFSNYKDIEFRLSGDSLAKIKKYLNNWKYLRYHGIIGRAVENTKDVIAYMLHGGCTNRCKKTRHGAAQEEVNAFKFDSELIPYINLYADIHAQKLNRKYSQIKTFHYMDKAINHIATNNNVSEYNIRMADPLVLLDKNEQAALHFISQTSCKENKVHYIDKVRETIRQYDLNSRTFASKTKSLIKDSRENSFANLVTTAHPGRVSGEVFCLDGEFNEADLLNLRNKIVVAATPDIDLVNYIRDSKALVIEQVGVTNHLALICKELEIPTIMGMQGALARYKTGDFVAVDADACTIKPLKSETINTSLSGGHGVLRKSDSLELLRRGGVNVPACWNKKLRNMADPNELETLAKSILNATDAKFFIIRSNYENEEKAGSLKYGYHNSMFPIGRADLYKRLCEFVNTSEFGRAAEREYFMLVQEYIEGEFSGIISGDTGLPEYGDFGMIECVSGTNEKLTSGNTSPEGRIIFDKNDASLADIFGEIVSEINARSLIEGYLQVERISGSNMLCEWTQRDGTIYWLQARAV